MSGRRRSRTVKDRVMMERAGIAAMSYGLVLAAHVDRRLS